MSRKLDIRARMQELQKEFSELSAEMKEIESIEKRAVNAHKYKDYLFKVGTYGSKLEAEEKIVEASEEDRETAQTGKSGLVYTGFSHASDYGYVLLKAKEEYKRAARVTAIVEAVNNLASDNIKDKEPHIKVILGEAVEEQS